MDTEQTSLGTVDFSAVEDFELLPAARYPGTIVGEWDHKPANPKPDKPRSININIKTRFDYERKVLDEDGADTGETEIKSRPMAARYNTHPDALFRIKRDLISLGADPVLVKGPTVNLQALIQEYMGGPAAGTKIWVHVVQRPFTPEGADEAEMRNEISKIEKRVE